MSTRPFEPEADASFVQRLYVSARRDEVRAWGLVGTAADSFLHMQHAAQLASYAREYPTARRSILLFGAERIGSMLVHEGERELVLVDIALLPEHQRHGHGTRILRALLRDAEARNLAVRLSVRPDSPALALYRRLGFEVVEASETYLRMRASFASTAADRR